MRSAFEVSKDIEQIKNQKQSSISAMTARHGASGISLDSLSANQVNLSVGKSFDEEITKTRYLGLVNQGRLQEQAAQSDFKAKRTRVLGALSVARIKSESAIQEFNVRQGIIEQKAGKLSQQEKILSLDFMAKTIKRSGMAAAANAYTTGQANASAAINQGNAVATQTLISGFSNAANFGVQAYGNYQLAKV